MYFILVCVILNLALFFADEGLVLSTLPYSFDSLEPAIDAETMEVHWGKHHKAYTDNANIALKSITTNSDVSPKLRLLATEILKSNPASLSEAINLAIKEEEIVPPSTKKILRSLRNNGGGFLNHNEYFQNLAPVKIGGGHDPTGPLEEALIKKFGSINEFREKFIDLGMSVFGSGWVWLVLHPDGSLDIITTPNQDRPPKEYQVIIGCDVWEHAYYLKHRNRRRDYLVAFWGVVNMKIVEDRYTEALRSCNK